MNPHTSSFCTTGQPCPISGIWQSMGYFKTTVPLSKGMKMPSYCGTKVRWVLVFAG
ncbi:hypothetical protein [Chryseobacterium sp. JAH]|uniref:hypothetical protein n=1 Tax=Chryseobacterium sp. JAH TaxID=1742858 RepID=UPI000AD4DD37|nr:hypothetical protein [Chryseobacterium sp. JAH]